MNTKIITTAAVSAFIFFGVGTYVGLKQTSDAPSPPPKNPRNSQIIASLRQDNQSLKAEVAQLKADIEQLDKVNVQLAAQIAAPPPPAPKSVTLGWMPRYERQRLIMNYLRQIEAARDQFVLENGHAPASVDELVGFDRYIKTVRPVSGEDYSSLSMASGQLLSVTTADGMTVTYDPSGANTTRIETPPEVARAQALSRKVAPAIQKATDAYLLANPEAKNRPNPQALIPYFATPQDSVDFLEMIEAQKAAFEAEKAASR